MRNLVTIISFLLLTTSLIFIDAADPNFCPASTCGDLSISYPFKLPTTPQTTDGCSYVDLRCNGAAAMSLPSGGEFYVRNISYEYPYVQLYDPDGCLARRLIGGAFSLASTPFKAAIGDTFTFYACPSNAQLTDGLYKIECLSNVTNATIATEFVPRQELGCEEIGSWELPVLFNGFDDEDLYLTWDSTTCPPCAGDTGSWSDGLSGPPLLSSAFVVIGMVFATCSCLVTRKMARRRNAAAARLPVSVVAMAAPVPPRPVCRGLEESKIDYYTKVMVVGESIVDPGSDGNTCPICLERFEAQEVVRSIVGCDHCFHGDCIETWLIKSRTCPVCRIILSHT